MLYQDVYSWPTTFEQDINHNRAFYQEFFRANKSRLLFNICTPPDFRRFAAAMRSLYAPGVVPGLHLRLPVFADERFQDMSPWGDHSSIPHGTNQAAAGHFSFCVTMLQILPSNVIVHLHLEHIWGDYLQLENLSRNLGAAGIGMQISIRNARHVWWNYHRYHQLHQKLTVAALTGVDMTPIVSSVDERTRRMCHSRGCTGFYR